MLNIELWLHQCHHQLEKYQATQNPASSNFMDVLKNLLTGIEGVISEALDVVFGNEANRAGEATELTLVAIE